MTDLDTDRPLQCKAGRLKRYPSAAKVPSGMLAIECRWCGGYHGSPDVTSERRCQEKRMFQFWADAQSSAKRTTDKHRFKVFRPYLCNVCRFWHVTSKILPETGENNDSH